MGLAHVLAHGRFLDRYGNSAPALRLPAAPARVGANSRPRAPASL